MYSKGEIPAVPYFFTVILIYPQRWTLEVQVPAFPFSQPAFQCCFSISLFPSFLPHIKPKQSICFLSKIRPYQKSSNVWSLSNSPSNCTLLENISRSCLRNDCKYFTFPKEARLYSCPGAPCEKAPDSCLSCSAFVKGHPSWSSWGFSGSLGHNKRPVSSHSHLLEGITMRLGNS